MSHHKQQASVQELSPNAQQWANWVVSKDASGSLVDFDAGQSLLNQTVPSLPTTISGISIVDTVNGLFSADPVVFGNPDLRGQRLSAEQMKSAFTDPQAIATIELNASYARIKSPVLGSVFRVLVTPVVKNAQGQFVAAPVVGEGTQASVPYLKDAWLINPDGDLTEELRAFRMPTNTPPTNFV